MANAWTGNLRLCLRPCHKYNILMSSNYMYFVSTNAECAEVQSQSFRPVKGSPLATMRLI